MVTFLLKRFLKGYNFFLFKFAKHSLNADIQAI